MRAITLRNLPPELARMIEQRSVTTGTSLNRTVIDLLEEALGLKGKRLPKVVHRDLDDLAGSWSEEEAAEFDRVLAEQRQIDPELWS